MMFCPEMVITNQRNQMANPNYKIINEKRHFAACMLLRSVDGGVFVCVFVLKCRGGRLIV